MDPTEPTEEAPKTGKPLQTFLARITVHESASLKVDDWLKIHEGSTDPVPTNNFVADLIHQVLYEALQYFAFDDINVTVEKV
jgi:hypothetical protein